MELRRQPSQFVFRLFFVQFPGGASDLHHLIHEGKILRGSVEPTE